MAFPGENWASPGPLFVEVSYLWTEGDRAVSVHTQCGEARLPVGDSPETGDNPNSSKSFLVQRKHNPLVEFFTIKINALSPVVPRMCPHPLEEHVDPPTLFEYGSKPGRQEALSVCYQEDGEDEEESQDSRSRLGIPDMGSR